MFFLLRATFWICVVLALLPLREGETSSGQFSAGDAFSAATSAVADASRFCTRQPEACAAGAQAASAFGQRAQAGAKRVYGMVAEPRVTSTANAATPADEPVRKISSQNSLTETDRAIPWRAPAVTNPDRAASADEPRRRGTVRNAI